MDPPLVITDDDVLLDDLVRLAAAAGVEVRVSRDAGHRGPWRAAPAVLLDAALVGSAVAAGLPRRSGVTVVASAAPDSATWGLCVRLGVERTVVLREAEDLLISVLADTVTPPTPGGRCVAVVGACGGAGASTLATATAVAAAGRHEAEVLLVDGDPWAAGLDAVLDVTGGVRWTDLVAPAGRLPAGALRSGLPSIPIGSGSLAVLGHDRERAQPPDPDVADAVLDAARRSGAVTVVDLPREPGPFTDRVLERADLAILISPADLRGALAGRKVVHRLADLAGAAGLVVRGPCPSGIGADDLATSLDLPLIARVRASPSMARDLDRGSIPGLDARGSLGRAAAAVLLAAGVDGSEAP